MSFRPAATPAIRTLACATVLLSFLAPDGARAALTLRVEGLEPALNDAWSRAPDCAALRVGDLVRRGESLAITTSTPLVLSLSRTTPDPSVCTAQGWRVSAEHDSDSRGAACARSVCGVLDSNGALLHGVDAAWQRSGKDSGEAPPSRRWTPASPSPAEVVWFSACAITLLLLLALALVRIRSGVAFLPASSQDWTAIGLIAVAGLALRAVLAARTPILIDEAFFFGRDSFWREFGEYETVMNPPFYRLLSLPISIWAQGAPGPGRVIPVLLGFSLVLLLGRLGSFLGGRSMGVAAAMLAAFHPGLVMATVYHRAYAALVSTTALSLLLVAVALRTKRPLDRYLAATALAAVFESHYFGLAVLAGVALWIAIEERGRCLAWLGPSSLVVVLCAPFAAAALVGAHQKERLGFDAAAAHHGRGLAETLPAVLAGVLRPELQDVLYTRHGVVELGVAGLVLLLVLWFGAARLGARTGTGLLVVAASAALVPVFLAFQLVTVREFQAIAAAVPVVALAAAIFSGRSVRSAFVVSGALGLLFVSRLPLSPSPPDPARVMAHAILNDKAHWPIFVWAGDQHGYVDVALRVGLSRPAADEMTAGRDSRIRALRSCSTAAVREAAQAIQRPSVRILFDVASCSAEDLAGSGVTCAAATPSAVDCQVDLHQRWGPVEEWNELLSAVIPPGNEAVFVAAAAPLPFGKADADGTTLSRITIHSHAVSFELTSARGAHATLVASPVLASDAFGGTQVAVEPATAPEELRSAVEKLSQALQAHLTPDVWDRVSVRSLSGRNGKAPVHLAEALAISALAGIVLLGSLWGYRIEKTPPSVPPGTPGSE